VIDERQMYNSPPLRSIDEIRMISDRKVDSPGRAGSAYGGATIMPHHDASDMPQSGFTTVSVNVNEAIANFALSHPQASPKKKFGTLLRVLRERHGLSRSKVEELSGVDATTIAAWERGEVDQPRFELLSKVAQVYNVSTRWLLDQRTRANLDAPKAG
jgi:DNA-binding XRE family transcriptional regulator